MNPVLELQRFLEEPGEDFLASARGKPLIIAYFCATADGNKHEYVKGIGTALKSQGKDFIELIVVVPSHGNIHLQ
jgi:hypothetical protein